MRWSPEGGQNAHDGAQTAPVADFRAWRYDTNYPTMTASTTRRRQRERHSMPPLTTRHDQDYTVHPPDACMWINHKTKSQLLSMICTVRIVCENGGGKKTNRRIRNKALAALFMLSCIYSSGLHKRSLPTYQIDEDNFEDRSYVIFSALRCFNRVQ